jgi:diguanylate cyclase (GGDEF)-like protein
MKTPIYKDTERILFTLKITGHTCLCVFCGIYFGFSPCWLALPTDPFTLTIVSLISAFFIAAPMTYWAGNLSRNSDAQSNDLVARHQTDFLTGAQLRSCLDNFITETPNSSGSILMIDIDNFKSVNDTYGHIIGDQAISQIGKTIRVNIREEDSFYRFGGEEFVVFLKDTAFEKGLQIAQRICHNIAATPIVYENVKLALTVSIGGTIKTAETPFQDALAQADRCLYQVKESGRNNVAFSQTTPAHKKHLARPSGS